MDNSRVMDKVARALASYTQLYIHCVWATSRREHLITPSIEVALYPLIAAKCRDLGCVALAIGGVSDHVHLLVRFDAMLPISKLVGQVKGASAHAINHTIRPGYPFKWQDGYGAFTISKRSIERVSTYVLNQKQRHANSLLINELEYVDEPESLSHN
jgi:REP-associated tyrosine transposase